MRPVAGVLCGVLLLWGCTTSEPVVDTPAPGSVAPGGGDAGTEALSPAAMPSAEAIDPQWTIDTEPEGGTHAEDSDSDSGSDWLAPRDPAELVWGLGALGCPQTVGAEQYPLAVAAQQGRYRTAAGSPAVALQLRFADPSQAAGLLTAMGQDAAGCTGPAPEAARSYERRYTLTTSTPDELQVSFREYGPGTGGSVWHVLGARSEGWVGLLYVEQPEGAAADLPDPAVLLP